MSRVATLLRALLCLALLLNGTVSVHAAGRMASDGIAVAADAGVVPDASPCHEGMDMAMPMESGDGSSADDRNLPDGLHDCCTSGNCDGFCAQHAPALTWLPPLDARYPVTDTPAYRADAHASVRLPHRLRPPILVA